MHKRFYEEPLSELLVIRLEEHFMRSGELNTGESFGDQTGTDDDDDWE